MTSRAEVLVCCCRDEDIAVLRSALRPDRLTVRAMSSPVKAAHRAVSHHPLAFVLGVGRETISRLEVIPVIRAVGTEPPIIVIAEEESLDVEREARRMGIFYYLVRPVDGTEVAAVFKDALRAGPAGQGKKP